MQSLPEASALLGIGAVFVLLFITLGPLKFIGPFMQLTRDFDEAKAKSIAVRAFVLAVIAVVVGGLAGQILVEGFELVGPKLRLDAAEAALGPLGGDQGIDERKLGGIGRLMLLKERGLEDIELVGIFAANDVREGVDAGLERILRANGFTFRGFGTGGFLRVSSISFDLCVRGHIGNLVQDWGQLNKALFSALTIEKLAERLGGAAGRSTNIELVTQRTTLSSGVVKNVQESEVETLIGLLKEGRPVHTGIAVFTPVIDTQGNLSVSVRVDKRIISQLNIPGEFTGDVNNSENIGKSSVEFATMWNENFPDNQITSGFSQD